MMYIHILHFKTKLKHFPVFRGIFGTSALFQNLYVFNPRFIAETLIIFCGTVVRKHWPNPNVLRYCWTGICLGVLQHSKQKVREAEGAEE
jgi:hypothetical protein